MKPLFVLIHTLNPWGGHDKSTLEIVKRLSKPETNLEESELRIISYSLVDSPSTTTWGKYSWSPIRPEIKRPALLMIGYFWIASFFLIKFQSVVYAYKRHLYGKEPEKKPIVHSTGTCSLLSDVVHVQFIQKSWKKIKKQKEVARLCKSSGTRSALPLIGSLYSIYHDALLQLNIWTESFVYTREKTYIVLSQKMKQDLFEEFGIHDNVHVVYHGVDPASFSLSEKAHKEERKKIREDLKIREEEIVILLVGELERKGLASAMEGLSGVSPELRDRTKLLAIGNGSRKGFFELASQLGVQSQFIQLDNKRDIHRYYQAGDIFLLPTYYEPFGLVVLEAMASGLPPIVSASAGAAELIRDGVSGILLQDPAQPAEVTEALVRLIENPTLRTKMGLEAKKIACDRNWDVVSSEYRKVLRPLLGGGEWQQS